MNFFTEIETAQQKQICKCMPHETTNISLKPNQRIKADKRTGIIYLEEKERWKSDGKWHNCWVRIAVIE